MEAETAEGASAVAAAVTLVVTEPCEDWRPKADALASEDGVASDPVGAAD